MNVTEMVHAHVQNGLVLNEQGKWVPLANMREREAGFLAHIENGEVLYKKKWISIGEALAESKSSPTSLPPGENRDTKQVF